MKFKAMLCAAAAAVMMFAGTAAMAEEDVVTVMVDNEKVEFDQNPIILDGTTLVPIRAVFEKAGAQVDWDGNTRTATLVKGDYTVTITVGDSALYKNGQAVSLSVSAIVYNDRILIPVRAIGEAMDFDINWDGFHSTVFVGTDGTEYRPYAARRYAFRETAEAAKFYSEQSVDWSEVDVNGDGSLDDITFTRSLDVANEKSPLIIINGRDYSHVLKFMKSTYAIAVVDIDKTDSARELMIVEGGDNLTAWFFRFDGNNLFPITNGNGNASIKFVSKLFFDERSYILSDLEGMCCMDIMITGSAYQLEDNVITQYRVSNASKIIPRKFVRKYDDNMIYYYTPTDTYKPGTYKGGSKYTMAAKEFERVDYSFEVLNMYIDETNPSYIELYVEFPNGIKAVLTPFVV